MAYIFDGFHEERVRSMRGLIDGMEAGAVMRVLVMEQDGAERAARLFEKVAGGLRGNFGGVNDSALTWSADEMARILMGRSSSGALLAFWLDGWGEMPHDFAAKWYEVNIAKGGE